VTNIEGHTIKRQMAHRHYKIETAADDAENIENFLAW
jgi:hypothetical protein